MPFENTMLSAPVTAAAQGLRSIAFGKLTDTAAPLLSYVQSGAAWAGQALGQGVGLGAAASSAMGSAGNAGLPGAMGTASQKVEGAAQQVSQGVSGMAGTLGAGGGQALGAVASMVESGGLPLAGLQQAMAGRASALAQGAVQSVSSGQGVPSLGELGQLATGALPSAAQFSGIPTVPALSRLSGLASQVMPGSLSQAASMLQAVAPHLGGAAGQAPSGLSQVEQFVSELVQPPAGLARG